MTNELSESPRSLGRYELVHLLGQGGMGEVYFARISGAAGFEKPCIVKTILPALLKDGQFLERFHHEAKVLVHLVHSSIAQVYDMGETGGTYYMALEYVAGVDVAHLAEQSREKRMAIPVPVALYLGQHMGEGLGYAHRKTSMDGTPLGIVHRDVSPHNVMVSYEGEVKVIDFGLAKSAARSKYTLPATVMGKLGYMSPEQARAEPLDHRSDIYSCGVVVWELLAGRPLVPHGTVGEMMASMANPSVPSLCGLRRDVSPALDAVVRRALEPLPQNRYARADDFARALNAQLLETRSALSAEEVGTFVRALCPEAYSSQRKLISSLSRDRSGPSVSSPTAEGMPAVGVAPNVPAAEPIRLEATSVRPVQQVPMASPVPVRQMATLIHGQPAEDRRPSVESRAPQALVAAESSPSLASRRVMLFSLGLAAFGLVSASVGGTLYFLSDSGEPPPPRAWAPPPPRRPPHGERWGQDPRMPPPPPGMPPPEGPPGGDTVIATPVRATAEPVPVAPAVDKVPAPPPARERPRPKEPASLLVKSVVPVLKKGGRYGIPAGHATGLKPDMVLTVVGPPDAAGMRRPLGQATVEKVMDSGTVMRLDAAALAAREERFVALPDVRPPPVPAPEPGRVLRGGAKRTGLLGSKLNRKIVLYNGEDGVLTNCVATLPSLRRLAVGTLVKGPSEFSWNSFKVHTDAPEVPAGSLRLQCAEGSADFLVQN
ncbi:serine/threonine protein kinase [Stigmatella aurantiaca]|uniref:Probable serine/threonine-protein kinase n=1 Tax=Stigmatella aurantiaca (strain DW4/3-1) TaxID=378806 RepID=Q095Q7_STIAD|nr:serine/threonine-protein kinase [Stigmatella aurantiaca]ADO68365.1 Serine/threonine protein kinase [Stigmatella aurantiaca DW4/3-1]EAU67414.1 probable serine/threonine-protein kinase [Stigmatella aurantiaca DW4/3-1]